MSIYGGDDASMYSYPSRREPSEYGMNYSESSPTENIEEGSSAQIDKTLLDPIQQTRTMALINLFSTRTADFLNGFSKSVETKLQNMDKQLHELETTVLLYEKKLDSLPPEIFGGIQPVEFQPVTTAPEGIAPPPSGYQITYQGSNVQQTLQPAQQQTATSTSAIPSAGAAAVEAPVVAEETAAPEPVEEELSEEEIKKRDFLERLENDEELMAKWQNYRKLYKLQINILQLEHKIKSEGEDIQNLKFMDIQIRSGDAYKFK